MTAPHDSHDRRAIDNYFFNKRLEKKEDFPLSIAVGRDAVDIFIRSREIAPGEIEIQDGCLMRLIAVSS